MFVLSKTQFAQLSGRREGEEGELVDIGAGDGSTTSVMANFYSRVTVTELSKAMRPILTGKGFRLVEFSQKFKYVENNNRNVPCSQFPGTNELFVYEC